jgi:hypothetical protein
VALGAPLQRSGGERFRPSAQWIEGNLPPSANAGEVSWKEPLLLDIVRSQLPQPEPAPAARDPLPRLLAVIAAGAQRIRSLVIATQPRD